MLRRVIFKNSSCSYLSSSLSSISGSGYSPLTFGMNDLSTQSLTAYSEMPIDLMTSKEWRGKSFSEKELSLSI